MRLSRTTLFVYVSALGLVGCHHDVPLLAGYMLYDLDGSNQAILGHDGAVGVSDVTALATEKPFIFVEVGGDPQGRNCAYKLIDTSKHLVVDLAAGSPLQQKAIATIKSQKREAVYRSCAVRS